MSYRGAENFIADDQYRFIEIKIWRVVAMNKIKLACILTAVCVLLVAGFPATNSIYISPSPQAAAAAGTNVPLVITNPMPKSTVLTLTGSSNMTIYVGAGQTVNKSIPKAIYKFTYAGCQGSRYLFSSRNLVWRNVQSYMEVKWEEVLDYF
jgi:hypothetical protein